MIINHFILSKVEQVEGYAIGFLTSDCGLDWYESQSLFAENKLKIEFENNGLITRLAMDASELWPLGKSVADVELKNVPKGVDEKGTWIFDGENIVATPIDYTVAAIAQKKELMNVASKIIETLQDAVDLLMSTSEEEEQLLAWKKYRLSLNRLDASLSPNIVWPTPPVI